MRARQVLAALATAVLALGPVRSWADTYPNRPITLVVPFAAGGPSDAIARVVGQKMGDALKQQVLIENVAGAGGTTGAGRVARAEGDGYTLLIHHPALAAGATLYKSLQYDTEKDLVPVGLINTGPMVLLSSNAYAANTAAEYFAKLKQDGGKVTLAHAGVGSNSHLCGLLIGQALGIKPAEVPYRGTGPAMTDLVAGQVEVLCDQSTTAVPQIQGKRIKAFAVTSPNRLDVLPDLPTVREAGQPGLEFTIWHGLYAAKGTPQPVIDQLNKALQVALEDPQVKARFAEVGTTTFPADQRSPAAHKTVLAAELAKWRDVIGKAGIRAD